VVLGDFRVDRLLGSGGMGVVFAGRRLPAGEPVAVKVMFLAHGPDWKGYELFERGSRVLQGLRHPGLPRVHAFGEGEGGSLVLVREAFDGGTLEDRIRQGARLDPAGFRRLSESLLGLLEYLHGRVPPVLHRDIKPRNLMFRTDDDWDPVLVDFDTVAAPGPQEGRLTIVLSPGYTAPEQLAGDVSAASDLYSLGATLVHLATHVEPDLLPRRRGRIEPGRALAGLEAPVRAVLLKLVEPDRAHRYASAEEALRDLRRKAAPAATAGVGHPLQHEGASGAETTAAYCGVGFPLAVAVCTPALVRTALGLPLGSEHGPLVGVARWGVLAGLPVVLALATTAYVWLMARRFRRRKGEVPVFFVTALIVLALAVLGAVLMSVFGYPPGDAPL